MGEFFQQSWLVSRYKNDIKSILYNRSLAIYRIESTHFWWHYLEQQTPRFYLFIFLNLPLKPPKIRLRKDFFAFIFVNFILLNLAYNWLEDLCRIAKLQTYLRSLRKNLRL